jgi:predicted transcriptional regulator
MTVRAISIEAYKRHIDSGKQATQWMKIYTFIDGRMPMTRSEISETLGMRMSSVCGRIHELVEAGLLRECDRRRCEITGEPAHTLESAIRAPDTNQQSLF